MQFKKAYVFIAVATMLLSLCCGIKTVQATGPINSVTTIISDMQAPQDAYPHGVPKHYSWANGAEIGMGNDPKNFKAMMTWGQLYEAEQGNPATNTRVQIRNIKAYYLSKQDNQWRLLQSSKGVEGAAYREDFAGDANKPADVRSESDGTISAKAGGGHNYHFWTTGGRASINPNDIGGIFTTIEARLILDDPNKLDDRETARYLLNVGGDYWLDLSAGWDNFKTNGGIATGRFKYVTTDWQAFNMTTLPAAQIRTNEPPIE
ncbi:hypothetical protein DSM106972_075040 [Dulcicalothrix desertica PCC 7102]|uniref:Uncharacterized protein n=1 Tax=Dulcicalothrix desertica PCC 7102 TaxID=232991 RepID=A0A3S1AGL9_9CYAN|nr:hypothetical protein [Dulcicalothrix desertica]RUT00376.1 hypothetical protein DSM106972_075040 [Dulcicalothrix desertica PCC 7102]TWH42483.1 hypothetical protein CAL7102_06144 [Dulcicalothrix desertica PCC 7102]